MTIKAHGIGVVFAAVAALASCGGESTRRDEGRGDTPVGEVCTETFECVPNSICFSEFCVGQGSLRTSLSFFDDTDLDLHLLTPSGTEIYFASSGEGGFLDVDQCVSSCGEGPHVENIVFDSAPASGRYEIWVENYDGRATATFDIEISGDDVATNFAGSVGAEFGEESEHFFFDL